MNGCSFDARITVQRVPMIGCATPYRNDIRYDGELLASYLTPVSMDEAREIVRAKLAARPVEIVKSARPLSGAMVKRRDAERRRAKGAQ